MPDENYWIKKYQDRDAFWMHDGNEKRPHALLTSGLHSGGFFNSEPILEDPLLVQECAAEVLTRLRKTGLNIELVDRVVAPAMGGITLAHEFAYEIASRRERTCLRAYVEKAMEGETKIMEFKRTAIKSGEIILVVEDVCTSVGSVKRTIDACIKAGAVVLPFVGLMVNRTGLPVYEGYRLVGAINRSLPTWTAEECPLCARGSKAIAAKGKENWALLNGEY